MKKLYLPLIFSKNSHKADANGCRIFPGSDAFYGYFSEEKALEKAKEMSMGEPSGKVIVFEATVVVEPRKIEFAEKKYNSNGELLI
jgi:hypothetical protein